MQTKFYHCDIIAPNCHHLSLAIPYSIFFCLGLRKTCDSFFLLLYNQNTLPAQAGLAGGCILKFTVGKHAGILSSCLESVGRGHTTMTRAVPSLLLESCTKTGMKCFKSCFRPSLPSESESSRLPGMKGMHPSESVGLFIYQKANFELLALTQH